MRRLVPDSKVEPPLRVAARRGRPASRPGETAGEESQDRGGFDPLVVKIGDIPTVVS